MACIFDEDNIQLNIQFDNKYDAIKEANPDDKLVQLKSLEALEEVAKGDANKIFIPFEATSALSSLGSIKDVMSDDKKSKKRKNTARDEAERIVEQMHNDEN